MTNGSNGSARRASSASRKLSPASDKTGSHGGHRRRGDALKQAIFEAALEQLGKAGFSSLTMEGVASCARTGKAALYRRWASKEELMLAALDHLLPSFDGPPDTGTLEGDLREMLRRMIAMINSPSGSAVMALMSELGKKHRFVEAVHRHVLAPREGAALDILRRAADRGEIRRESANQLVADTGPAIVLSRLMTQGSPIPESFADEVLSQVLMPLLVPPSGTMSPGRARATRATRARS